MRNSEDEPAEVVLERLLRNPPMQAIERKKDGRVIRHEPDAHFAQRRKAWEDAVARERARLA